MTEQMEIIISFRELTLVSFQCTKCRGEITLDLKNEQHRGIRVKDERARVFCVLCGAKFDSYLHDAFDGLFKWYDLAKKSDHEIFFRINRDPERKDANGEKEKE